MDNIKIKAVGVKGKPYTRSQKIKAVGIKVKPYTRSQKIKAVGVKGKKDESFALMYL